MIAAISSITLRDYQIAGGLILLACAVGTIVYAVEVRKDAIDREQKRRDRIKSNQQR